VSLSAAQLADLVQQQHVDEAAAFEEQVQQQAGGEDSRSVLAEAVAAAAALWVTAFGSSTAVGAGEALGRLLRDAAQAVESALAGLGERAYRAIVAALPDATRLGERHAGAVLRAAGRRVKPAGRRVRPPRVLAREAAQLPGHVGEALSRAQRLLTARPDHLSGILAALGVARAAVSRIQAAVAWLVHRAVDHGAKAVAEAKGVGRLWVAEADACVRCAAYSGEYAEPDAEFEGGLSFDPQQRGQGPDTVDGPPLHPHCRCRTIPWSMDWPVPLPRLLQARAAASVAEGISLPSESGPARVRAARALLASGRRIPSRAAARARAAVRSGRFS